MSSTPYLDQHMLAVLKNFVAARPGDRAVHRLAAPLASSIEPPEPITGPRHVVPGATVDHRIQGERRLRRILMAYAQDALVERVALDAPLALGLLGHTAGRTVEVALPHGRLQRLDILAVQERRAVRGRPQYASRLPLPPLNAAVHALHAPCRAPRRRARAGCPARRHP